MKKHSFAVFAMTLMSITSLFAASSPAKRIFVKENDCAAVQNAIDQAPKKGFVEIILPKGDLVCTGPVVIDRSNTSLLGWGTYLPQAPSADYTRLILKDGVAAPLLVIGATKVEAVNDPKHGLQYYPITEVQNIAVSGLTVDGNRDKTLAKLSPDCMHEENVDLPQCAQMKRECYDLEKRQSMSCHNDGGRLIRANAITLRRCSGCSLKNVEALRGNSGGLTIEKLSSYLKIEDFSASDNALDGLAGYQTHHSIFRRVKLNGNIMSGVSIDFDFVNNTFEGLELKGNGDNGIFSHSLSFNVYKNVTVMDNGNHGIYLDGVRHFTDKADGTREEKIIPGTCHDDTFENVYASGNRTDAFKMNHPCHDTKLINWVCIQSPDSGRCLDLWPETRVKLENVRELIPGSPGPIR